MGQSDDIDDSIYSRHQDLCQKLNMDATAASEAWRSYETIRQNYTLEGNQLHWIGCALYVACRKSTAPTVGRTGTNVEGNCVSLTRLLQLCNLPLRQFFAKSRSWADMANMPQDFHAKIEKLEGNFAVSMIIFRKYQPIFTDIFKDPADDVSRPPRSRRHKATPCTPARVFEFCWTLFICIKGASSDISDYLVNSYHLLLACCDLIYSNALLANRKDLLNPNFPGLPANFNDENYAPPQAANCIISLLCERHEAVTFEAQFIKEYHLRKHLKKLFSERVLRGDQSNFTGILENLNFDGNNKAINKAYEQHVLSVGDFDERIFLAEWRRVRLNGITSSEIVGGAIAFRAKLSKDMTMKGPDASDNIGSPIQSISIDDFHEQFQSKREQYSGQSQHLAPPTPLTGRKYLRPKVITNVAPISQATQSVIQLQTMLAGHTAPSDNLLKIFHGCSQDVKTVIEAKVHEIGEQFCAHYTNGADVNEGSAQDFGRKGLYLGQTLFYKLLEIILNDEMRKRPSNDVSNLLTNEVFLQCLLACCLEIVIYSYKSSDKMFPWILRALNLEPYYFYKVIEIIVRAEDQLSRDVVKHLNQVEEKILESLAWHAESPLWTAIENSEGGVPSCEEVSLPGTLETVDPNTPGQPALRKMALERGTHHDVQQSPISSASERFQSPVAASGIAKKRLFPDTGRIGGQSVLRVGQNVLSPKVLTIDGNPRILVLSDAVPKSPNAASQALSTPQPVHQSSAPVSRETPRPRRTGSVALFFRKFYNLAYIRMEHLCNSLSVDDVDVKKKIWTIFEYSVKERTELMKDRHLDQILMCSVYVIFKLAKLENNTQFADIMKQYRTQPQAQSHIYRSVLITKNPWNRENPSASASASEESTDRSSEGEAREEARTAPPTPSNMAGTSQNYGAETRGDLIKFYNTVYVPQVKEVANKWGLMRGNSVLLNLTLSPLPKTKPLKSSPVRRVTSSIMTRTLDPKAITASPAPQLSYCFSRSPAKDLEAINRMMITVDARKSVGKRLLSDDNDIDMTDAAAVKKTAACVARKLENIIGERRTQNQ